MTYHAFFFTLAAIFALAALLSWIADWFDHRDGDDW